MSSRRSSDEPATKRQKVYRACIGCVNSKTRCQDVVPLRGCLRCRTKQKECSLIESAADLQNSTDAGPIAAELEARMEATEEGWRMLSRRVETLERGFYSTGNGPSGSGPNSNANSGLLQAPTPSLTPVHHRPVGVSPMFSALNWSQMPLSETIFNLSSEDGYPDPVSRGLVTLEQMEMSFHLFKHRFSKLIPLVPFVSTSTTLPSHPFLRLAVLAFTHRPPGYTTLLDEAILTVSAGAVSPQAVLALLILSLAPAPSDASTAPISPLRMLSLAYSVGQALGLDAVVEVGVRSKWILLPEWASKLDQVLMWEAVKNRYNIMSMMHGRNTYLAPSLIGSLSFPQSTEYHPCITHLKLEAEVVSIFSPILHEVSLAEVEVIEDVPDIQRLLDQWSPMVARLERLAPKLRDPYGLLRYDAHSLRFSLAFRLSSLLPKMPSPIHAEWRMSGLAFTGINLLKYGLMLCELFNNTPENDLPYMPYYLTIEMTIALIVERRSVAYMRKQGQEWDIIQEPVVDMAMSKLVNLIGGLPAHMFDMTKDPELDGRAPDLDFNLLFGTLPDDWLQQFNLGQDWMSMGLDWMTNGGTNPNALVNTNANANADVTNHAPIVSGSHP